MSPGLKRARQPFLVRNAITGVILAAFAFGMWNYSMNAVKQDVFDDVDEEAKALAAARRKSLARQEEQKANASRTEES
jgi:cytochrome c oxidase assembly factor 3